MEELVIATNNQHKVEEIRRALGNKIKLISLKDLGCREEIPEDGTTLKENAYQKAKYVWDKYKKNCFADDTGLMVEALDGAPGVYSARYAGEHCSFDDNIDLLLENMEGKTNRNAYFATVICLIQDGEPVYFEGKCEGCILTERYGRGGFGYDPIFMPKGYGESFAEISMEEKNKISHRGKATEKLIKHLLK
ncbi:MAG: RdgB/HAM1 family non-canonical purine NTP pyrophosphatase [Bacteroidales bacterium]|jgi:XTP/dITP diphosphohydrolase|nr:RdgB/HAM1 family non-canonical purine NTP pyrophosphatase [Bacteroidales bacterium]MEE0899649.1 RdgB/HAM1 family non-canonical purine NTP pyrophosphatase [Bacteroidales bacterium]MEE0926119.1 RdgB/HAM1 family non-canonical purine NTP pyrophosphatase [Bacteroidales bacterium]MEE0982473.1 RdgB/HAM1 family non-canonical purine NTP pyrophosphatase [Bacteroidales bacterium]MEE0992726.1 RdgB/HAM1 family non-canonical purine NTP pyrophosphatase [Bacteroidales bacterium]